MKISDANLFKNKRRLGYRQINNSKSNDDTLKLIISINSAVWKKNNDKSDKYLNTQKSSGLTP